MKHIVTAGCSFTSLTKPNVDYDIDYEIPLRHKSVDMWTWVDWLRHYNSNTHIVYNYGCPTNDNSTIVESVLYGINKLIKQNINTTDIEVIIQWSCATRNSFFIPTGFIDRNKLKREHINDFIDEKKYNFEKGFKYLTGGYNKTSQPDELNDVAFGYLVNQFSHEERIISWLKNIILISSFCKNLGIKYKFFQLNNNISSYFYTSYKDMNKMDKRNSEPGIPPSEDFLKTKEIQYTWEDGIFLDNPYINYLLDLIDLKNDFWFYERPNHHKFGGSLEWTIDMWNDEIKNDSEFPLSEIIYYEFEGLDEKEKKEYLKRTTYGHPSALMWRKFYFEVIKPKFL